MKEISQDDRSRGRDADRPSAIPARGWKDIAWRVWEETGEDRVSLIAAGVAFYLLLAIFPALAAFVAIFGFFADPASIADQLAALRGVVPSAGLELIGSQLSDLASRDRDALGVGFLVGLGISLWSANNGAKTLFEALNIAYEEREKRSFLRLNLVALGFTLALMASLAFVISLVGVIPAILALAPLGPGTELLVGLARWPLLLAFAFCAILVLYRFGPSRTSVKWRWLTWGALLATVCWTAASFAFSWYLQNLADYNATYGSLGAIVGFMLWTWLSAYIVIVGAEIDAEIEHQTARDSTVGPGRPMGKRGATMADTLGKAAGAPKK